MYKANSTLIQKVHTKFFYESTSLANYKKSLQASKLFKNWNIDIFSDQQKSGFVGILGQKFVLLSSLPYNKNLDFIMYKTLDLTDLYFKDHLIKEKMNYINLAYMQLATIAKTPPRLNNTYDHPSPHQKFGLPDHRDEITLYTRAQLKPNSTSDGIRHQTGYVTANYQELGTDLKDDIKPKRIKRSLLGYIFGASAEEVQDQMNQHFTKLTDDIQKEFIFERKSANSVINLLNKETDVINQVKEKVELLIQKTHLDLIFDNNNLVEKYSHYIAKTHTLVVKLQLTYESILELMIDTLKMSKEKFACKYSLLLGLDNSCINLDDVFLQLTDDHFLITFESAPLNYTSVFKITCEISKTNTTLINNLHLQTLSLASIGHLNNTTKFRSIVNTDLLDDRMIIINDDMRFGLSCIKSIILFVNQQELFCSQEVTQYFPTLTSIQYDLQGKNLLHSLKDIEILNFSIPSLDITTFQRVHFNNITSKLQTLKNFIKHKFNPIKNFKQNPVELLYTFMATIISIIIGLIVTLVLYFCSVKIFIPALKQINIRRYLAMPARIFAGRTTADISQAEIALQGLHPDLPNSPRVSRPSVWGTTRVRNDNPNVNMVESTRVRSGTRNYDDSEPPPSYSTLVDTTVAFDNRGRRIVSLQNRRPIPAPRTSRTLGANNSGLSLLGSSILSEQRDRV